jgi:Do/DeqQ family serine protease
MKKTSRLLLPFLAVLAACSGADTGNAQSRGAPMAQPTRQVPTDAASMRASFSPVVKRAAPAVVNVYARRVVRQQVDPFWQMFGGGVPRQRAELSLGSGVIVRSDGVIVTNAHVVQGGQEFMVVLADRREYPAELLLADARTDLAVLKVNPGADKLPTLAIDDTGDHEVGDLVLAIGNPFGVGQTVTNGIISALNRSTEAAGDAASFIQTDAPINPGNSGGALVDMDGDLIGVNSMILSRSGTSSGVGFAIPAVMVKRVVETAVGGGHTLVRPWLGAKTEAVTGEMARSLGLAAPQGALVTTLYPGGPAARAGLRVGDIVTAVDGGAVNDPAGLNFRIATKRSGESVRLDVLRDGRTQTLTARAEAPPSNPAPDERTLSGNQPLTGVTVVNLSPAVADELGLDPFAAGRGVLLRDIPADSFAARQGFRPGDLIRGVNGREVGSTRELQQVLSAGSRGVWAVTIERDGKLVTARFRG